MERKNFHHPFEPYDIQQQFMEGVYECIENGYVGIFESPTGTGKSLSLICGALTWLREHKRKKYDEALATVEIDEDEPVWIVEHARELRGREIRQMRNELESRLVAARDREKRIRERGTNGTPPSKRVKHSRDPVETSSGDEQFVLDHYESDGERCTTPQPAYSAETTRLMQKLGILQPKDEIESAAADDEQKIYFCSRTHSQLSQFVGELRRVKLPPGLPPDKCADGDPSEEIRHLTLGSRKNLCINPKVSKLSRPTAINERCIELQQKGGGDEKRCRYLPSKESEGTVLRFRDHALAKIRDIEDLAKLGSDLQICPYYASRPAISPAEMITLPYPLLLQKSAREALGISLKGHVVIIDEAHNLMSAVEGTYSAQISDSQLKRARDSLLIYLQKFRNRLKGSNRTYVTQVVRVIDSLLQFTDHMSGQTNSGDTTSPGALLAGKAVDQINLTKLVRYIDESRLARKVEGYAAYISQQNGESRVEPIAETESKLEVPTLTSVQNFLMTLMNPSREGRFMWSKTNQGVQIQYLLLDPSEHFRDIVDEARAVILAGGTMSPMEDYSQQLFPYTSSIRTFSCGHLIPTSSLFVRSITSDSKGRLDFAFRSRNDNNAARLGNALLTVAKEVRGGMIVFLPSYGYLDNLLRVWRSDSIMEALEKTRAVHLDSRSVSAEETFKAYSDSVRSDGRGALLVSVIGGKLSEGINFSDELGRCVVVVGLPYPNLETPEWRAKSRYLDNRASERGEVKGQASREHAENVCMRSVNQAIGRAIRHKNDWASILLFDARYADARIQAKLPGWIKSSFDARAEGTVEDVVKRLKSFFAGKI